MSAAWLLVSILSATTMDQRIRRPGWFSSLSRCHLNDAPVFDWSSVWACERRRRSSHDGHQKKTVSPSKARGGRKWSPNIRFDDDASRPSLPPFPIIAGRSNIPYAYIAGVRGLLEYPRSPLCGSPKTARAPAPPSPVRNQRPYMYGDGLLPKWHLISRARRISFPRAL